METARPNGAADAVPEPIHTETTIRIYILDRYILYIFQMWGHAERAKWVYYVSRYRNRECSKVYVRGKITLYPHIQIYNIHRTHI